MIDKDLFPKEYEAIERLKIRSRLIQDQIDNRRLEKRKLIEKCRRELDEKHHG